MQHIRRRRTARECLRTERKGASSTERTIRPRPVVRRHLTLVQGVEDARRYHAVMTVQRAPISTGPEAACGATLIPNVFPTAVAAYVHGRVEVSANGANHERRRHRAHTASAAVPAVGRRRSFTSSDRRGKRRCGRRLTESRSKMYTLGSCQAPLSPASSARRRYRAQLRSSHVRVRAVAREVLVAALAAAAPTPQTVARGRAAAFTAFTVFFVVAIRGAARVAFAGARVAWEGGRSAADSESRHSRGHTVEDTLQTIK